MPNASHLAHRFRARAATVAQAARTPVVAAFVVTGSILQFLAAAATAGGIVLGLLALADYFQ